MYVRVPSIVVGFIASVMTGPVGIIAVPQTSDTIGDVGTVALAKHCTELAPSAGTTGAVVWSMV